MATSYPQHYDVFISHRGPELKATFATDLYRSITAKGLQVFLDKPEMQVGQEIPAQIEAAIKAASVHIAIFSPRYAESEWCLNELLSMVKSGKTIIPVFYNVKLEHLRRTQWTGTEKDGPYAKALRTHEEKQRHGTQTIHEWRKVLSDVANKSGLELDASNGDTGELLCKVVENVLRICPPPLDVAKYPTGLEKKFKELEKTVLSEQHRSKNQAGAKVVGIWGLGGIGKTTLARYFLKVKRSDYQMSSILFDVKDDAAKIGLNYLQSTLIKELKHKEIKIERWEEGKEILKKQLKDCHALVILDDVDHADQLDAFLPIKNKLNPRSLILVTTRDRGVLERFGKLVDGFVEACHGLPLSLKVLGALLRGKNDIRYWEELLDGLNKLPADIENRLRSSYNSLNVEEQQIFLDIACFCIGEDKDRWIKIWSGSQWSGLVGFRNLESKCLVEVDSGNRIRMHDYLRDMGRKIADSPGSMAHRLWYQINNFQDIKQQLEQSSMESTQVRGIRLTNYKIGRSTGDIQESSSEGLGMKKRFLLNFKWVITQVLGLRMTNYSIQGFIGGIQRSSPEVWPLKNLQLLEAGGNDVESILTRVQSPKLIWLRWFNCNYDVLPSSILMHDLRVFEVYSQTLKRLWTRESLVPVHLTELIICAPLVKFPKSLGQLQWLEKLEAKCKDLTTLPEDFYLPYLKYLKIESDKLERLWKGDIQVSNCTRRNSQMRIITVFLSFL
eukprot:PITA_07524